MPNLVRAKIQTSPGRFAHCIARTQDDNNEEIFVHVSDSQPPKHARVPKDGTIILCEVVDSHPRPRAINWRPENQSSRLLTLRQRYTGTVKFYNQRRGYGYIVLPDGTEALFEQAEIRMDGFKSLGKDDTVEFTLHRGKRANTYKATNIVKQRQPVQTTA